MRGHTRFTLPLASVPYLHHKTHLPVVIDPSHGTGHAYLVPAMAAAGVAVGADGLIIEVHPDPEQALSDGYQSLNFCPVRGNHDRAAEVLPRPWVGVCRPMRQDWSPSSWQQRPVRADAGLRR